MSRRNGDKSRFNRLRKQGIDRRMRQRKLFSADGVQPEATLANKPKARPSAPPDETTTSR
jgi:hypothetical protein